MFFPEFLLQLSPRDRQVTWLDPRFVATSSLSAATSVDDNAFEVPDGMAFILQSMTGIAVPGLAQGVRTLDLMLAAPGGAPQFRLRREDFTVTANAVRSTNWSGSILIPPAWLVLSRGSFDAGAAGNSMFTDLAGMLMPIGNVQRI